MNAEEFKMHVEEERKIREAEIEKTRQKLNLTESDMHHLIYDAVEEMQQDLCGEDELNEASEHWLEASPLLLDFLVSLIKKEEECPTD